MQITLIYSGKISYSEEREKNSYGLDTFTRSLLTIDTWVVKGLIPEPSNGKPSVPLRLRRNTIQFI